MTQNTATHNTRIITQAEFLDTLYLQPPEGLYLELRCIHPETGEVRTLWTGIGDAKQHEAVLKQAEKLNNEGYGVYYAPCLRQTKQGKAESAELVPALWVDIDCDDDPERRKIGLAALDDFVLPPSAIVNSGGGWHAYWLLDTPFTLQNEDDRQRIARVLHGLFSALDGDPGYVKSVASVMRLPGSTNTKPSRNNTLVQVIAWQPDRRYPLSDFDWLDVRPPKPERIGKLEVITLNGNGHRHLPPRTEAYLTSGAPLEQRNQELFAAACQLRDAGYSQRDAEGELTSRYLADGNGSENPIGREKEARATIASAFSRPPREPIPQAPPSPKTQVDDLVSRFHREEVNHEQPSAEQIAAVVTACAALDPVQWAAERKRLKTICGEDFRLADLDRLYKEARRDREREAKASEPPNTEQYLALDGCMVYERQTTRGTRRQVVADWTGQVLEWITRSTDTDEAEHIMRLRLASDSKTTTLDVPSEYFGDANALQRFIAGKAGGIYAVRAGMNKHLVSAILKLSGDPDQCRTYGFMGWTQLDGKWVYVSPGMSVNTEGSLESLPEVELEARLRDYRLVAPDWGKGLAAFEAAVAVFPPEYAAALVSFALLPLLQRFFPPAAPKPALHLSGTTGSGKSEIASLMAGFYGPFTRDTPPGQWGDTVNTVEVLGYALADALFWVDDYKQCYADERTFTRFLQSYSRGMGRGRLTREAKLRHDRPCRGLLLSTGETTIEGEASVLSRMLVLEIPPWESRDPGGRALVSAELVRDDLPAFTACFLRWLAARADAGTLTTELASRFEQNAAGYRQKLTAKLGRQANTGRMIGNWAVLVTVYQLLADFFAEMDEDYLLPAWQDTIFETVGRVQGERAGDGFIQALNELLASGEAVITPSRHPDEPRPGVTIIGYEEDSYIYLLPEIAYREAVRIRPLKFSAAAIGSQLREEGWLVPGSSASHLTVQLRVRGRRVRVWRLKAAVFNGDSGDDGDSLL
ncbi:MAG: DUF927 domain-containing protein [Anaerolineaceae bacterium]|nr:DUF927 domain-containing protein [Anaerolineaceae bacterium]